MTEEFPQPAESGATRSKPPHEEAAPVADFAQAREQKRTEEAAAAEARANEPFFVSETDRAALLEKASSVRARYAAPGVLLADFTARQQEEAQKLKEDDIEETGQPVLTDAELAIAAREALLDAFDVARNYNLGDVQRILDTYPKGHTEMDFFAAARRAEELLGSPL